MEREEKNNLTGEESDYYLSHTFKVKISSD
jgi:hypothetical protein